jgi:hypothetical protein
MKTLPSCLCIFGLAGLATAGVGSTLMDQIGPNDGSNIDTSNMLANQLFEASFSIYSVAAIDDFDNPGGIPAAGVDAVIGGWNGYVGIDGIIGLSANFYSDENAAGANLVGDVSNMDVAGTPAGDPNWTLAGMDLVGVAGTMSNQVGTNYAGLIPNNEFGTNGQTGMGIGFTGDLNGWQCNPGGGFGFGAVQVMPNNMAIRVLGGSSDPCDQALSDCPYDITGPNGEPDGLINVDDVLGCIGTFGSTGDGLTRPLGDVNPLPSGNCYVDVDDLLDIIGAFGGDCLPIGACCYGVNGCDDGVKEADCMGDWNGEGSSCATSCVVGACCNADASCDYVLEADCNGAFNGGLTCADVTCVEAPANTVCSGAIAISDGDTGIDNTMALSEGPVDFTLCDNFGVEGVFNDLWYSYTATCDGTVTVSTCDTVDFDSRLAVYDACGGTMLVCNDDCGGANNGLSSELALDLGTGDMVVIRVGNFAEGAGGTGVLSVSCSVPSPGACCLGPQDCLDGLYPADCADFGGDFMGNGTDCMTVMCGAAGDSCGEAVAFVDGANTFDTSNATDSGFGEPDDTQCDGTYLDWTASPDAWGRYEVSGDGTVSVSLCDAGSYDTSLVLYEGGDCGSLTQVGCNGDSTAESGCQSYYSGIYDHPVTGGSVIYIRMGGWQGATGPGTCTITFTGAGATGACCLGGDCLGEFTSPDCTDFGGSWYAGEACADVSCPQDVTCDTGNGANTLGPDDAWTAATSDSGAGYLRAMGVNAPSVSNVDVYGLSLIYSGGWGDCADAGAMGMSVELMDSTYGSLATASGTYAATNLVYAGIYALHGWAGSATYAGQVDNVSAYSGSAGQGECWFLWMSSTATDAGVSAINDGTGWAAEVFGLNYCITE